MKMMPIFSLGRPVFSIALLAASMAATSIGGFSGSICGIRLGNLTRISLTTDGQAVLMMGSCS